MLMMVINITAQNYCLAHADLTATCNLRRDTRRGKATFRRQVVRTALIAALSAFFSSVLVSRREERLGTEKQKGGKKSVYIFSLSHSITLLTSMLMTIISMTSR
jgi:ribosomal protein S24E